MPRGVRLAGKDQRDYVKYVVQNDQANAQIVEHVTMTIDRGEWPTIVFVQEVEHGEALAAGLSVLLEQPVPVVSGQTTTPAERSDLAQRMRAADPMLKVVVATEVWGTGIDIPNLASGHNAGDLQAPIGLRQRIGRTIRADGDRAGEPKTFKWYDYVRSGVSRYRDHATKRAAHYERAGFDLSPLSKQLMQQVLQQPVERQPMQPVKEHSDWDDVPMRWRWLAIFYPPIFVPVFIIVLISIWAQACPP
jgi:superfamily II DNA or RNA helicase